MYTYLYTEKGIDDRAGQRSIVFVTYMFSYASSGQGAAHRQRQPSFVGCTALGMRNIDIYVSRYRKKGSTIEPESAISFSLHTCSHMPATDRELRADRDSSFFWLRGVGYCLAGGRNADPGNLQCVRIKSTQQASIRSQRAGFMHRHNGQRWFGSVWVVCKLSRQKQAYGMLAKIRCLHKARTRSAEMDW